MPIILSNNWDSHAISTIAMKMPSDRAKQWEIKAGQMFFKHRRATYHLRCIEECYAKMIGKMPNSFDGKQLEESTNSSYAGPLTEILLFHLDGFFEAERSGHNFVMFCLRAAGQLQNPPSSFHDFYKSETKRTGTYPSDPPKLGGELCAFWADTGQRTKGYRDCFNHHVSLAGPTWQHAVNMKWANESWQATLHLPDNPEAQSHKAFTFDDNLDALDVCEQLNVETEYFLKQLMVTCAKKWEANVAESSCVQFTLQNIRLGD
jgi:hypothetical protein